MKNIVMKVRDSLYFYSSTTPADSLHGDEQEVISKTNKEDMYDSSIHLSIHDYIAIHNNQHGGSRR